MHISSDMAIFQRSDIVNGVFQPTKEELGEEEDVAVEKGGIDCVLRRSNSGNLHIHPWVCHRGRRREWHPGVLVDSPEKQR